MKKAFGLLTAIVALALGTSALAANFTPGNLVIYRMGGDGSTLTNRGSRVWLDEYTTSGTLVQSILIRTNYFGANSPLLGDGTSAIDGLLTLSADGRFVVLAGYGATLGQFTNLALVGTFATEAPRVVATVDQSGYVNSTTALTNSYMSGSVIRSAASTDGTNLWFAGNAIGVNYTIRGSNNEAALTSAINSRQVNIFSNQLYYSAGGTSPRLGYATNACCFLPTSNNVLFASLPGVPTDTNQPISYVLLKLRTSSSDPFDTLYFTDDGTLQGNNVQKYSLIGGTNWVNNGSIGAFAGRGLAAYVDVTGTTNVHLFITGGGATLTGGDGVYAPVDSSGYNGSPTVDGNGTNVITGVFGKSFRGIVFAPVGIEPGVPGQISVGPVLDYRPSGLTGGPFSPSTNRYSVANLGTSTVDWGASAVSEGNWLTITPTSSTLASGGSVTVVATVNAGANSLPGGSNYTATITFTNATSGLGDTIHYARLSIFALRVSTVTNVSCGVTNTAANFDSVGPEGGPFCPANYIYNLSNSSGSAVTWSITNGAAWFNISATNGTLAGNASTNITLTINSAANDLVRGYNQNTLYFNDTTPGHGSGDLTRRVSLAVDIGFYSDFSTYSPGDLLGQDGWVLEGASTTKPLQITNGCARIPGPGGASDNQDVRKETGLTNYTSVFLGLVSVTTTSGPSGLNPAYGVALRSGANGGGFANYRFNGRSDGAGGFVYATALAGFSAWGFESTGSHSFGSTNITIIQTDPVGSNSVVYVNPTSPVLNGQTTNVVCVSNSGTGVGAVILGQFENAGAVPMDMNIRRLSVSRNYSQVYDELHAGAYANFSASPTTGAAPVNVTFTDRSSGVPLTWAWNFGDAGTSSATNPVHGYTSAGTYDVRLIVTGPYGSSTNIQVGLIVVTNNVVADPYGAWATSYGLSGGNAAGGSDPDGDGMSNTNEYLAGFNPTNSAAFLKVISIVNTGLDVKVTYLGANGDGVVAPGPKTNILESSSGTGNGSYSNNFVSTGQTNILSSGTGVGVITNMIATGGATNVPSRYYRVRVP